MTTGTRRKPPVFGPESWSELAGRPWSHWDLWFAAVAVSDYGGSLDELEAHLVGELRSHAGRQGAESKISHMADLRSRLEAAGLTPADLATPEVLADKRILARARKKVSDHWVEGRTMTPEALQQLAWLAVGGRRFSRYVEAAARLGSDHWMPIEAMAESALPSGHRELAVEVFRAADRHGHHQPHLRQRCLALTGVDIDDEGHDPRPKLRVVESPGGHP